MGVTCRLTQRLLVNRTETGASLGRFAAHLAVCLRCQAEAVRYRMLRREMADLVDWRDEAPRGLLGAVDDAIDARSAVGMTQPARFPAARKAALVGALAATAGTVVVVRVLKARPAA